MQKSWGERLGQSSSWRVSSCTCSSDGSRNPKNLSDLLNRGGGRNQTLFELRHLHLPLTASEQWTDNVSNRKRDKNAGAAESCNLLFCYLHCGKKKFSDVWRTDMQAAASCFVIMMNENQYRSWITGIDCLFQGKCWKKVVNPSGSFMQKTIALIIVEAAPYSCDHLMSCIAFKWQVVKLLDKGWRVHSCFHDDDHTRHCGGRLARKSSAA